MKVLFKGPARLDSKKGDKFSFTNAVLVVGNEYDTKGEHKHLGLLLQGCVKSGSAEIIGDKPVHRAGGVKVVEKKRDGGKKPEAKKEAAPEGSGE